MSQENTQPSQFQYRRFPAVSKKISEITEKDIRVRIMGTVIDKQNGSILIDDGTGKADVVVEEGLDKINNSDIIRIFCRVLPLENGHELRAEIIQNMNSLDMDLHKRINN